MEVIGERVDRIGDERKPSTSWRSRSIAVFHFPASRRAPILARLFHEAASTPLCISPIFVPSAAAAPVRLSLVGLPVRPLVGLSSSLPACLYARLLV
jgi:hypothetical protein